MNDKVTAVLCPCGYKNCKTYGVSNGTFYQGCGWDKESAEFVAWAFNNQEQIKSLMHAASGDGWMRESQ